MFFDGAYFKIKITLHFEFLITQIFEQSFAIFRKLRYRGENSSKLDKTSFSKSLIKEMPAKSLKFCVSPTTKRRSCKIFAKLNRNHLLTANIFKIHKYQTFGRMKMHNMSTTWFANNKFKCYEILLHHKCFRSTHF